MRRVTTIAVLCVAIASPAVSQQTSATPDIDQRIDQSLQPAGSEELPSATLGGTPALDSDDVSLEPSTSASRLRTTLDPVDIEQRIDKGLTAAGEATEFPPDYAYGAFQRGWFLTAFGLALDEAKQGKASAQTLLGVLLLRGLGVKQDLAAAADWFGLAGNAGDREALYALGQLYLDGQGVEKDPVKAADYFRKAADKGQPGAARELGYLLLEGKGEEKNAMLAAAYLRRAAGLGDFDAQYTLAGLFVEGVGVMADEAQAARWFAEAARNGHVGAQVEYAILLFNGRGVPKDEAAAAGWFMRAANEDNPVAQVRLARLLAEGKGIPRDDAEAARWYFIAKERGLDDEFMEGWIEKLDEKTRSLAQAAADEWLKSSGRPLRTAEAPAPGGSQVDNQLQ
jgi:TPR repeat protein